MTLDSVVDLDRVGPGIFLMFEIGSRARIVLQDPRPDPTFFT
jgi:hypothetical protein